MLVFFARFITRFMGSKLEFVLDATTTTLAMLWKYSLQGLGENQFAVLCPGLAFQDQPIVVVSQRLVNLC